MSWRTRLAQELDRLFLATFNQQIPDSFENSYLTAPPLESVYEQTHVRLPLTPTLGRVAAGEYRFWLDTWFGRFPLRLRLLPARRSDAPLLLYHHGICETPYDARARRLLQPTERFDAHIAILQAPFHTHLFEPLRLGMASMHHLYQMLAGSLRMMEMVQEYYEGLGAPYTVAAGTSLGGIVSILYEGMFGRLGAVIPIVASPDMGRVMWDAAHLLGRELHVEQGVFDHYLNFTPYFERCSPAKFYPLLGGADVFFLNPHHATLYHQCQVKVLAEAGHISGSLRLESTRQHIIEALIHTRQKLVQSSGSAWPYGNQR